ncbi:DUF2827 domain-containing protein [Trinickia acidisoli]|uniref:DUF2827 domain-containing protein n=1 Tax=Trinickia acidisoli TaxID=2767482 RepID=UPI001A8F5EEE|nr:DUF2827 domain-containing protein [Trinickia acidisoli]
MKRPLRIGITIGLRSPDESLWINGLKQNALFLAKLFQASPLHHTVSLLNTTAVPINRALPWDLDQFPTFALADGVNDLDLLIELGGQLDADATAHLRERGTRLVSYCCSVEYAMLVQALVSGTRSLWNGALFVNRGFDALWFIPQVADNTLPFWQTLRRAPAKVVPFVWDPMFLEQRAAALPNGALYRPSQRPKRIAVMEPNHDIVKTCIYPVLIAERVFREAPDEVGSLNVCNAKPLAETNRDFQALMLQLDIVQAQKAAFLDRYDTPAFLAEHTDLVISHQVECPLNYFYFDVCWLGFPLIHNASMCSDLGYYYNGNDIVTGAAQTLRAIREHDSNYDAYIGRQRQMLSRYTSEHTPLVEYYDDLLDELMHHC